VKLPESNETRLLRLCARTTLDGNQTSRIRELCDGVIRWNHLLAAADRHAVLPLVAQSLQTSADDLLSAKVSQSLARNTRAQTFESIRLCAELLKIMNAFTAESIRVLSFKGPTLASLAYGSVALRPFGDLDILVSPTDAVRAARLLHRLGFPAWTSSDEKNLAGECEATFVRPDGQLTVDLHWALSRDGLPFSVPFEKLWAQAQRVQVGGAHVPTLATQDLCLFLCLHGTKHLWERLSWVCDIAELIRAQPQLDLNRLLHRADQMGYGRMVLLSLELARSTLDLPLPQEIARRASSDRTVQRMSLRLQHQLLAIDAAPPPASPLLVAIRMMGFHLRTLNRTRDRIRYLKYAMMPNPRDRNTLALPQSLHFLHLFTRPLRLFRRYAINSAA
jgi:hypothetical protein